MSVNFNTVPGPAVSFAVSCVHGPTSHRFDTYPELKAFMDAEKAARGDIGHLAECGDEFCAAMCMSSTALEADPSPTIQLSGSNAAALLRVLGYPVDGDTISGSDTAGNLLDRILSAEAANPDSTGYTAGRLAELREIAEFSAARGRDVQWV